MTRTRFWWWLTFWVGGLALWLFGPRDLRWLGWLSSIGIAPWFAITREQFGKKVTRGQLALLAVLLLALLLTVVAPGLFQSKWSTDPSSTRVVVAVVAALGVVLNARRTFGRATQHAA